MFEQSDVRGFNRLSFTDTHGNECSIQESSVDNHLWFGINNVKPMLFLPEISDDPNQKGWIEYPIPDCVHCYGTMHLSVEQVEAIIPILQNFVNSGRIIKNENGDK